MNLRPDVDVCGNERRVRKVEKKEVSYEGRVEMERALGYLESILESLRKRKLVLSKGDEFVVLEPGEVVELEVEGERKKDKEKLELKLSWRKSMEPAEEAGLEISSEAPVEETPADEEAGEEQEEMVGEEESEEEGE